MWVAQIKRWNVHYKLPADNYDTYCLCGVYGICDIDNEPIYGYLEKFVDKYAQHRKREIGRKGVFEGHP